MVTLNGTPTVVSAGTANANTHCAALSEPAVTNTPVTGERATALPLYVTANEHAEVLRSGVRVHRYEPAEPVEDRTPTDVCAPHDRVQLNRVDSSDQSTPNNNKKHTRTMRRDGGWDGMGWRVVKITLLVEVRALPNASNA